jgi:Zn-dependent protease
MFGLSYRIARVWGIPIKIHISLPIFMVIYAVMVLQSESSVLGSPFQKALLSLLLTAIFFISVAIHELAHSFVAIRKGCFVREIVLLGIGGVAYMENIPMRPADEIAMAIAGPLTSAVLGGVSLLLGIALLYKSMHYAGIIASAVGVLNLALAIFNLLPAFPMDGGRILRAMLTKRMGRLRATFLAARLGKLLALIMGIAGIMTKNINLVLIAIFIYFAAGSEYRTVWFQELIGNNEIWSPWGFFRTKFYNKPSTEHTVIIGPPPYRKGPPTRTKVYIEDEEDEDNPFDLFGM